jgi:hypothetical protein
MGMNPRVKSAFSVAAASGATKGSGAPRMVARSGSWFRVRRTASAVQRESPWARMTPSPKVKHLRRPRKAVRRRKVYRTRTVV